MAVHKNFVSSFYLVTAILILLGLAVFPDHFSASRHEFLSSDSKENEQGLFPIDQSLSPISSHFQRKEITLRELAKGSPGGLIVNFWATWCPPCIEELPSLEFFFRQLQVNPSQQTPKLITISVDEKADAVSALYRTLDFTPTFPVLHDRDGALARKVGTTKFPETYWINAEGKILYKWLGPQNWLGSEVLRTLKLLSQG